MTGPAVVSGGMAAVDPPASRSSAAGRAADVLVRAFEIVAATALALDLLVVFVAVICRYALHSPLEWADDVARLLLALAVFPGAAVALARSQHVGLRVVADRLSPGGRRTLDLLLDALIAVMAAALAWYAVDLARAMSDQLSPYGLPLNLFIWPLAAGAAGMAIIALRGLVAGAGRFGPWALLRPLALLAGLGVLGWAVSGGAGGFTIGVMLVLFASAMLAGLPVAFSLLAAALAFFWIDGRMPPAVLAQQVSAGIDNAVLLAIPFFVLTGLTMEATGMSARLIELLLHVFGRMKGGLNMVIVIAMALFSGVCGSKLADVSAVGSFMVPAVRRARQDPRDAVALLAGSAIMGETIPPCINLIILGYVANISIGGLFLAGLLPSLLMTLALLAVVVCYGQRVAPEALTGMLQTRRSELLKGALVCGGMIVIVFGGVRTGIATSSEVAAFAGVYALLVGGLTLGRLDLRRVVRLFVDTAALSGMILFIVAAAQGLAFVLTIQQIPHAFAATMVEFGQNWGATSFMIATIALLTVMGAVLEGAPALVIFAPLLMPVALSLGIGGLQYGIVLVLAMGVGLFAPPLGLGLYTACAVGEEPIEGVVRPILKYLAVLLACILLIALVPWISMGLPHWAGLGG